MIVDDDVERAADRIRPTLALYVGGMGARSVNFHHEVFARMGYPDEATSSRTATWPVTGTARSRPCAHPDGRGRRAGSAPGPRSLRSCPGGWHTVLTTFSVSTDLVHLPRVVPIPALTPPAAPQTGISADSRPPRPSSDEMAYHPSATGQSGQLPQTDTRPGCICAPGEGVRGPWCPHSSRGWSARIGIKRTADRPIREGTCHGRVRSLDGECQPLNSRWTVTEGDWRRVGRLPAAGDRSRPGVGRLPAAGGRSRPGVGRLPAVGRALPAAGGAGWR